MALRPHSPPLELSAASGPDAGYGGRFIVDPRDLRRTNTIIVDAQPAFREGVRRQLGFGFSVVGQAATVSELKALSESVDVGLALIGDTLREGLAAAVAVLPPSAIIVVLAHRADHDQVVEALELGASGYLLRSIRDSELAPTLRAVIGGMHRFDASAAAIVAEYAERHARSAVLPSGERVELSPRQHDVALCLMAGYSTRAIADKLGISVVTVRRHVSAITSKLNVATRDGAIRMLAA